MIDRAIAAVAADQHGVVTRAQLRGLGLSDGGIDHRVRLGRLHAVFRAVFSPSPVVGDAGRTLAAVLTIGEDAALSHRSAGELRGYEPPASARFDVTNPRHGHQRECIRVHRAPLQPWEREVVEGIPVTSAARTLGDLALTERPRTVERAIERSIHLGEFDLRAIDRLDRRRRAALERVLATATPGTTVTRADAEEHFLAVVRAQGLPAPVLNDPFVLPDGTEIRIDAHFRSERVAVELDGRTHRTPWAQRRDAHRDRQLLLAGLAPVRFPYADIAGCGTELARLLGRAAG